MLAAAGGGDPAAVRQAIMGGFAVSRVLTLHGNYMILRDFTPGGPTDYQVKDCATIVATAKAAGLTLPFAETALTLFRDLFRPWRRTLRPQRASPLELERRNKPVRVGTVPDRATSGLDDRRQQRLASEVRR
ncbi:MAG: NAD-binding protein [Stellaceae bacterium]